MQLCNLCTNEFSYVSLEHVLTGHQRRSDHMDETTELGFFMSAYVVDKSTIKLASPRLMALVYLAPAAREISEGDIVLNQR